MLWFFNTIILMIFSCYLHSMEYDKNIVNPFNIPNNISINEIIYFNIGGYKMDVRRDAILQFGGTYLNQIITDPFIAKDRDERIFIDRPKEEGKIVAYYIRTQQCHPNFDNHIIKNAARFFGIASLKKRAKNSKEDNHKPESKYSAYRIYDYEHGSGSCAYCHHKCIYGSAFT